MLCGSLNEKLTALHNPIKSDEIKLDQNVLHSIPNKWHLGKHMHVKNVWFQSLWVVPLYGWIHQERNKMPCYISKWQCIRQDVTNLWYLLYLVLTDSFKDLRVTAKSFTIQITCKFPYIFFFSFSQNTSRKRHLSRTSQHRAVPTTHHSSFTLWSLSLPADTQMPKQE